MKMNRFPSCGSTPIGLYPIVNTAAWLEKLLPLGMKTIQLRIKNKTEFEREKEIQQAIKIAQPFSARLFINDDWQLAIKHQAYGVHLGQEDLNEANIDEISQAGLRLGVSTHCEEEIARAISLHPSYIAYGPIYPTTSKVMNFAPQGLEKLTLLKKRLPYPLVAIGGINLDRIDDIIATGVDGVALISAITEAKDPIEMTRKLLDCFLQRYELSYPTG